MHHFGTHGFGARLREIRGETSQEEFGRRLGASRKQIADWESERTEPGLSELAEIEVKTGYALDWLLSGKGKRTLAERADDFLVSAGMKRRSYRIAGTVPAGPGHFTDRTDSVEMESLDLSPDDHVFVEVSSSMGESMRPVLQPGDMVLISRTGKIHDGDLVAAQWGANEGAVKIFYDLGDKIQLMSINLSIAPIKLPKKMAQLFKVVLIKKKG